MQWPFWSLLSAVFAAATTAVLAKIGGSGVDSNLATAIRTTVILVFTWLIAFYTTGAVSVEKLSPHTWISTLRYARPSECALVSRNPT
jgi:transporter family protein